VAAIGHFPLISWDRFVHKVNAYKKDQRDLNIWVGEKHGTPQGNYFSLNTKVIVIWKFF
jgi:hypothetical protein